MEKKIAHLGFIESTIERMANNSASIKGWSMAILAALLGIGIISGSSAGCAYRWIMYACAFVITVVMWFLDNFYIYQEKLYRKLYSLTKDTKDDDIDFSMDARFDTIKALLLKNERSDKVFSYWRVLINRTTVPFYSAQLVAYFLFFIVPLWVK